MPPQSHFSAGIVSETSTDSAMLQQALIPEALHQTISFGNEKKLEDELTKCKAKLEETKKELADSDKLFRESMKKIKDLERELENSQARADDSVSRKKFLEKNIEEARKQADKAEREVQEFKRSVKESLERKESLENTKMEAINSKNKAEKLANQLKQRMEDLEKEMKEFSRKADESQKKEENLIQQLEKTSVKLHEAEKALESNTVVPDVLQTQIQDLKIREEGSIKKAEYSEKRARESERKAEELEKKMEDISEQSKRRAMESKNREEVLEKKVQELMNTFEEFKSKEFSSKEKEKELERKAEELKRNADLSERKANQFEKNAADAKERLTEVEARLNIVERNLQENRQSFEQLKKQWVVKESEIQFTEEELGSGGWGIVRISLFRGTRVAAKTIHKQIHSEHNQQVFLREMNMAARLRHPNLVQFIGATLEGNMVILSELLPTSLRSELEKEPMPLSQTCCIGMDVARALNYLHLMQPDPFIHRDISSANVLLERLPLNQWKAKVADYGSVNLQCQLKTQNPGSPPYSAPEACNPKEQSTKMDIYSFGALLLEMLTGELPVPEERNRLLTYIRKEKLLEIIQNCLNENRYVRPNASTVMAQLGLFHAELSKKRS